MFGYWNFPCWLRVLLSFIIIAVFASIVVLQLVLFFSFTVLSRKMVQFQLDDLSQTSVERSSQNICPCTSMQGTRDIFYALHALIFPVKEIEMSSNRALRVFRFVTSANGIMAVAFGMLIPYLILALFLIITDPIAMNCTGCVGGFSIVAISVAARHTTTRLSCAWVTLELQRFDPSIKLPWRTFRKEESLPRIQ